MSNILIIKHGSLGDIAQISGVLKDIREAHFNDEIFILTTNPYIELLAKCPFINCVLIDERLPRWNLLYLFRLRKRIKKLKFSHVYDLQNSSRTSFYRKYLFGISNWSSTETILEQGTKKNDFDQDPVLDRFKFQLDNSKILTKYSLKPDFSWACLNIDSIIKKYSLKNFIIIFPFCSPQLSHKKWPYFNELIKIIKLKHTEVEVIFAPGPSEVEDGKKINATGVTNINNKALNIGELAGLIKKSKFVIANDTGPAHIAAHLGMNGVVLFGHHTSSIKVSIETEQFKAITVNNLKNLTAVQVYDKIKDRLNLIN